MIDPDCFRIGRSWKGRGIYAKVEVEEDAVLFQCPVLVLPCREGDGPTLSRYVFEWGDRVAIALGPPSLLNHSYEPCARYDRVGSLLVVTAIRRIRSGEEVTINYNGEPGDRTPVPQLRRRKR